MSRTIALSRMRLVSYVAAQRAWAPWLTALALIFIAHAGGQAKPNQAYAFSATILFAVFGWQAKLVLDTEPDEQRMLSRVTVGSPARELVSGLLAAAVAGLPALVLGVFVPLVIGALEIRGSVWGWLGFGVWIHLLAIVCGVGVGALASRALVRPVGWASLILVAAPVLVLILGSRDAVIARLLVPPLFGAADLEPPADLGSMAVVSLQGLAWAGVLIAVYAALRHRRS